MQKHDINSPALRDPKREWYDAEEVEEEMEALRTEKEALEMALFNCKAVLIEARAENEALKDDSLAYQEGLKEGISRYYP